MTQLDSINRGTAALNSAPASAVSPEACMAVLRRLSSGLAHDVRTPLTIIRNAVYLLRRDAGARGTSAELLDLISREIEGIEDIVFKLTEVTHQARQESLRLDLGALLERISREYSAHQLMTWRIDLDPKPFILICDAKQFRRVINQLVKNAVHAMKCRGELTVLGRQVEGAIQLDVIDTGPGIAPELHSRLFEPMATTQEKAMGLGLAFCKSIIERHGGSIRWLNEHTPGTAFRILLPGQVIDDWVDEESGPTIQERAN